MNCLYHWFFEPKCVRIKLENKFREELMLKAIKKTGGSYRLAKVIGCCPQTIYNYLDGISMTVGFLKKLCNLLNLPLTSIEKHIIELSWLKSPKLPFNLSTKYGSMLRAAILSDGSNTTRVMYKNKEEIMIEKITYALKNIFSNNLIVDRRISDRGIPVIFIPRIVGRVLEKTGVPYGKKIFKNPSLPKDILEGKKEVQIAYLKQIFDDEGEANVTTRKIVLYRGVEITRLLSKEFISKLEVEKIYGVTKIPRNIKMALKSKPPNLLSDESLLLHKMGIDNKYKLRKIIFQRSGYVTAIWNLIISRKNNIDKFRKIIGFTIPKKNELLNKLLKSYTKPTHDKLIYSVIRKVAKEEIQKKGFFLIKDIVFQTNLSYNSVRKRIDRLKRLNRVSIIEPRKYLYIDEDARNRSRG